MTRRFAISNPEDSTQMDGFDRQRLLTALILVVMALFVASGAPPATHWRWPLRVATVAGFFIALGVGLAEIALWLFGAVR